MGIPAHEFHVNANQRVLWFALTYEPVEKPVIANQSADWFGNLPTFQARN